MGGIWPTLLPLPFAFYRWENEKLRSKRRVEWLAPVHMYSWIWTEVFPSLTSVFLLIHHNLHTPWEAVWTIFFFNQQCQTEHIGFSLILHPTQALLLAWKALLSHLQAQWPSQTPHHDNACVPIHASITDIYHMALRLSPHSCFYHWTVSSLRTGAVCDSFVTLGTIA